MEFSEKPDFHLSAARVESEFGRIKIILQYQPADPFVQHNIAGLCCKRRPDIVCAAVFCHGRPVYQRGDPGLAVNY